jgi:predicted N-acyltransferase
MRDGRQRYGDTHGVPKDEKDYVIRVGSDPCAIDAGEWNQLLQSQAAPSPFMRLEYLQAMQLSGSAVPRTGWSLRLFTLRSSVGLQAACALYLKDHSYGEYVFDWAWANAYRQHGLRYYPKALVASPFSPVPGARLLARSAGARLALLNALLEWCKDEKLSSLHLLFGSPADLAACADAGLMLRHTVQFHWSNGAASGAPAYDSFEAFLATLAQQKRKKIHQEQRKVRESGVDFRLAQGSAISEADWDFFYACHERTYLEHGNAPYLSRDFFSRMARTMPEHWLMFIAEIAVAGRRRPIATSLIALGSEPGPAGDEAPSKVAYGRYWGALERVDCLHFDACYYRPIEWCIANGYQRFEGGAQGEHKMARALMPVRTTSAHWLAHPAFADAVQRFLEREGQGIEAYVEHLGQRSPFRRQG